MMKPLGLVSGTLAPAAGVALGAVRSYDEPLPTSRKPRPRREISPEERAKIMAAAEAKKAAAMLRMERAEQKRYRKAKRRLELAETGSIVLHDPGFTAASAEKTPAKTRAVKKSPTKKK